MRCRYQRVTIGKCSQDGSHLAYVVKKKGSCELADELDNTQSLHWKVFACLVMDPLELDVEALLRKARRLGMIFVCYAIALPIIAMLMPESGTPSGPSTISLIMICLMPLEILLIYALYLYSRNKTKPLNFIGIAVLMYTLGTAPSIYGFVIGFSDIAFRPIGPMLGLLFSIAGLGISFILSPRLLESQSLHSH